MMSPAAGCDRVLLSVRLPQRVHRALLIHCVRVGCTVQRFTAEAVAEALNGRTHDKRNPNRRRVT